MQKKSEMSTRTYDIVVVGAGAAGLLAAGRAASLGAKVLLIEKMRQAGRKLMITGKGRCNITNASPISEFIKHVHPNGRFVKPAFSSFYNKEIIELLEKLGVECTLERGGRYFPTSNKALDVVNALVNWTKAQGVTLECDCTFKSVDQKDNIISKVKYQQNGKEVNVECKSLIICTGGLSYPATGCTGDGHTFAKKLGHKIEATRPALVPIEIEAANLDVLDGLNLRNTKAVVWVDGKKSAEAFGEISFMPWGLSGPIILTLSRQIVDDLRAKKNIEIALDLKPALDEQKLDARLMRDIDANGKFTIIQLFKLWVPKQLIKPLMDKLDFDPNKVAHQISGKERKKIRILLKDYRFTITGNRPYKEAIVTAGGITTSDISGKSMQSKKIENLFFAGEIIDVDADTGGYNLQIAFSTGWLAGTSAFNKLSI